MEEERKPGGRIIEVLRWIGAVILPLPIGFIVCLINQGFAIRYIGMEGYGWKLFEIYNGILGATVIGISAYKIAPRGKFLTATVIATMYGTMNLIGTIIQAIVMVKRGEIDWWQLAVYTGNIVGAVIGIIIANEWRRKEESREG
jgi:hypothetical protein